MLFRSVLLQSSRAIASAKRINEVLDTEIDLTDDRAGKKDALVQKGRIEFRGVSFRYYKDSQEKVLDDINLTIESGQTVGIIGSTGCGKTTLVSMIPRLYDADEGSVLAVSYTHLGRGCFPEAGLCRGEPGAFYRREEGRGSFLYGTDLGDRIEKIWISGERGYNRSQTEKRYAGIFGAMAGSA